MVLNKYIYIVVTNSDDNTNYTCIRYPLETVFIYHTYYS